MNREHYWIRFIPEVQTQILIELICAQIVFFLLRTENELEMKVRKTSKPISNDFMHSNEQPEQHMENQEKIITRKSLRDCIDFPWKIFLIV